MTETIAAEMRPHQTRWLALLDAYARAYPEEEAAVAQFRAFVRARVDAAERTLVAGHLTGSAWLVSRDGQRTLLTHHRKLDRWLQPGGHADGDTDLSRVALREAEEESGLTQLVVEPAIFDIDRHEIPARGDEPAHWHYDVRFVVRTSASEAFVVGEESHALSWREIDSMLGVDSGCDESLRRMAHKWLARAADA